MTIVTAVPENVLIYQLHMYFIAFTVPSEPKDAHIRVTAYRK